MVFSRKLGSLVTILFTLFIDSNALSPSDSYRDADLGQSSYVGGGHNIDPAKAARLEQLWNVTFKADEKHWARPLVYTPESTGRQLIFLASTENYIRTLDAATGETIHERQVQKPWPMGAAYCTTVSQNLGVMGTPTIDPKTDIAYFYVKSYIEDYRMEGGPGAPLNGIYYFYAVDVKTLQDVEGFPMLIDGIPAENDPRRIFLGGLILQRPSLLQLGDIVYAGFGGLCEAFNYTGAVIAVDIKSHQVNYWVTQAGPDSTFTGDWTRWSGGGPGGIWQAGQGLASDGQDIFFLVDNGAGSADTNGSTIARSGKSHLDVLSETAVRVSRKNGSMQLMDWFRPYDWQSDGGQDIGSGGFALLGSAFKISTTPRLAVVTSTNPKMYVLDLENLGGYRQGSGGTDGVLQTIPLDGEVFGGVGSYPYEGGYIYVNPGNSPLSAYRLNPFNTSEIFSFAGKSTHESLHWGAVGLPTVTSKDGEEGSGIVWITEPTQGIFAYNAVPVNGTLTEIKIPKIEGANKFGRPVFGDGRLYIVDAQRRLIALGTKEPEST